MGGFLIENCPFLCLKIEERKGS